MGIITNLFPFLARKPKSGAKWRLKNGTYHITGNVRIDGEAVYIDGERVPELNGRKMTSINVKGNVITSGTGGRGLSVTCSGDLTGGASINLGDIKIGPNGISGGGIEIGPNGIRIGG